MAARFTHAGARLSQLVATNDRLLQGHPRGVVGKMAAKLCGGLDPLAPANENRGGDCQAGRDYSHQCKQGRAALHPAGRFCLPGDLAGCLRCSSSVARRGWRGAKLAQANKHTNAGMLRERYNYYCEKVVKVFIKTTFYV